MDLSKLSNEDLLALQAGDLSRVSSSGLRMLSASTPAKPVDPTADMSWGQKALAGAGKAFVDIGRGAGQLLGMVSPEEVAESRRLDAALMNTGAGMTGNIVGNVAAMVPTAFIPGANTVVGAGVIGAVTGALQPRTEGESLLRNIGTGAALGAGSQYGASKLAQYVGNRYGQKVIQGFDDSANKAPINRTLESAQSAGYVVPPSEAGAGMTARVLEGLSGKAKTEQLASIRNQRVTNNLAKRSLGIAEDVPLSSEALDAVREQAGKAYGAVEQLNAVNWDKQFLRSLNVLKAQGGATKSPAAKDVEELASALSSKNSWNGKEIVFDIKNLREMAKANFLAKENVNAQSLAKAQMKAATLLEDLAERNLMLNGADPKTIQALKDSRQLIAKTYDVERAFNPATGTVDARELGKLVKKGKPLTAELKTAGDFGLAFPKSAQVPQSGFNNPLTVLDMFGTGVGGAVTGPAALAWPAARMGARYGILSGPAQRTMMPSYGPGMLDELTYALTHNKAAQNAGLFGPSVYFGQE